MVAHLKSTDSLYIVTQFKTLYKIIVAYGIKGTIYMANSINK